MLQDILNSFSIYYGLDWLALATGLLGMYMITNKNHWGFSLAVISSLSGFWVAIISDQYGYMVYNLTLMLLMARGFIQWSHAAAENAEVKTRK